MPCILSHLRDACNPGMGFRVLHSCDMQRRILADNLRRLMNSHADLVSLAARLNRKTP